MASGASELTVDISNSAIKLDKIIYDYEIANAFTGTETPFINELRKMRSDFERSKEMLNSFAKFLENSEKKIEQTEAALASEIAKALN